MLWISILLSAVGLMGQVADNYTTRRGVEIGGFWESNPIFRPLVEGRRWGLLYAITLSYPCLLALIAYRLDPSFGHISVPLAFLASGSWSWVAAVKNYKLMKKYNVSLF